MRGLSDKIKPENVVEVIDHRKINEAHKFPNSKAQIEFVGSAATLIAEKFHQQKTKISKESAALLFSAIISNTINFQASITTNRDRKIAGWLKTKISIPKNYIREMFIHKSQFTKPLKETFMDDFATFSFNGHELGIAQLEITNVDGFINANLEKIKDVLIELKRQKSLEFIFLNCIDLEKAFNKIVIIDRQTQKLLSKSLKVEFNRGVAKKHRILMRKEIAPLIKEFLDGEFF